MFINFNLNKILVFRRMVQTKVSHTQQEPLNPKKNQTFWVVVVVVDDQSLRDGGGETTKQRNLSFFVFFLVYITFLLCRT